MTTIEIDGDQLLANTAQATIRTNALAVALKNAADFASRDRRRPAVCVAQLAADPTGLTITATDSYVLIEQHIEWDWHPDNITWQVSIDRDDAVIAANALTNIAANSGASRLADIRSTMLGLTIEVSERTLTFPAQGNLFPDTSSLLEPADADAIEGTILGQQVMRRLTSLKHPVLAKNALAFEFTFRGDGQDVEWAVLREPDGFSMRGLLMPIRGDKSSKAAAGD